MRGSIYKVPQTEENSCKAASPNQNSLISNISSKSEGFHLLELHTPMLGNDVGLLMMVIIVAAVLMVHRKYRKWLAEVKRRESAKLFSLGRALLPATATVFPPTEPLPAMSFPAYFWEYGGQRIQTLFRTHTTEPNLS